MAQGIGVRVTNMADGTVSTHTFQKPPIRLGRNPLNELVLDHPFVSQFHAIIEAREQSLVLQDLGSTNGLALRATGRIPKNHVVDLAQCGYEFAIVSLLFQVFSVDVSDQRVQSRRRPLGVTRMVAPDAVQSAVNRVREAQVVSTVRQKHDAYRSAWAEVLRSVEESLKGLEPSERQSLLATLARELPALTQEPEFQRVAASIGASVTNADGARQRVEAVALQGLRELARDFVPGQGQPETVQEVIQFLGRLQATLDVFIGSFVPLRDGFREFESELALRRESSGSPGANPEADLIQDSRHLAALLLGWRTPTTEIFRTVSSLFTDLMAHQVAMVSGVMLGVRSLLKELSPPEVEAWMDQRRAMLSAALGNRHKALWKAFEDRYRDIAEDERQLYLLIFGNRFAQAYAQTRLQAQSGAAAAPNRRGSSTDT